MKRSRSRLAAVATLLVLAAVAFLAPADRAHAQATLSAESIDAIEAVFTDIEPTAPGCAAGVVTDLELAWADGFGMANLDYGIPITPRSNFYLGSVSKQFTASAVAHAARAGHLSLDDPIQRWVPEIPEYERPITVRHMIHHTSGLRDYLGLLNLSGGRIDDVVSDEEVLALIARQRGTNFPAGEEYGYSNSGYFLLSIIIERATGQSLREYLETTFFGPLGMDRTRIHDDRLQPLPDRVVGYAATDEGYRVAHPWNYQQVGAGGVYSSIEELARWDRNHYTEEVGGPGFTDQLLERGVLTGGDTISYAFGLTRGEYGGLPIVEHGGSLAGFRSHLLRFPEERTAVLVLCSFPTSEPSERAREVADVVLADRLGPLAAAEAEEDRATTVELDPSELDAFVGHWRASIGPEAEIVREGERLFFIQDEQRAPMAVLAENRLRIDVADLEFTFSRTIEGTYAFANVVQGGQEFTAERFDPAAAERDFSALVGEYHSEELDATYRLFEGEEGLMMEIPPARTARVYVVDDGDRVRHPAMTLELERREGRVVGFTLEAGRVRGVYFERRAEGEFVRPRDIL